MTVRCPWCMESHALESCPRVAGLRVLGEHGVVDPMASEELNDHVALRMIAYRTYAGQLERELREAGVTPSKETQSLNPDRRYEAA